MSDPDLEDMIGWKDEYKENPLTAIRVSSERKITNGVVLKLQHHYFSPLNVLMNFLSFLVPQGFLLPQDAVFRKRFNKCKNEASKLKKNKGKNPSQYINFMAAPFFKDPVLSASPLLNSSPEFHNLSLQPEVKRLKLSDSRLKRKLDMNQNNLAGISDELAASKMKVVDLEDQIKNLKVENNLYKKKYAGSKSSHSTTPSSDGAKILEPNFVTIRPLSDKHPNIYERCEGGRGLRESYYIRISKDLKPTCDIKRKELTRRTDLLFVLIEMLSGIGLIPRSEEKEQKEKDLREVSALLSSLQKKHDQLFLPKYKKMSVLDAVNFQSLLRINTATLRKMRIILSNLGYDILPSEPTIRRERLTRLGQTQAAGFIGKKMSLELVGKDNGVGMVPVLMAKNLADYISTVVTDLIVAKRLFIGGGEKVSLLISGDKGGGSMKLNFEVVGIENSCVFDCHMFCIFEGRDSMVNLSETMAVYRDVFSGLVSGNILVGGHQANVFLGGDFAFLDAALGHQGSAATFFCNKDHHTLSHIRNHQGRPHTPESCPTTYRTLEEYNENFNANVAWDIKGSNDLAKTGKEHLSVIGRVVFPISGLNFVVPGPLHIKLGITLKLFEMLLAYCSSLDQGVPFTVPDSTEPQGEWEKASEDLIEKENKVRTLAENFIDLTNLQDRFSAFLSGDTPQLNFIAANSANISKRSKKKPNACMSPACILTCFDDFDLWIQCSTCERWVHALCETLNQNESAVFQLNSDLLFECLACKGIGSQDLVNFVAGKISDLNKAMPELEDQIRSLNLLCERYKQENAQAVGVRQGQLLSKLDELKVVRQAYHGNVFVGNHCKIVLSRYHILCDVISDQPDMHKKFSEVFKVFSEAQSLMSKKRILCDREIRELRDCCTSFGTLFPVYFPEVNLTRKMHELIFHVPRFVEEHKTIGLFSEEDGESLHNVVNQELRSVACLRNSIDKFKNVVEKIEIRSKADSTLVEPKCRKCKICANESRKSFLRAGMCPYAHLHEHP